MAPRGRPKKRGVLRIDAALDAMSPFGFNPKLVRSTVKELLNEYGGDDGWVFIEEGSYTLLIETILEKLKDGAIEEKNQIENGRADDHTETSAAGCSSGFIEPPPSNLGAGVTVKQSDGVLKSTLLAIANEAFDTNDFASEEGYWRDDRDYVDDDRCRNVVYRVLPANAPTVTTRRQKHFHGCISSDDKVNHVHLTPAPIPEEVAKLLKLDGPRKRKKRWDVKPGDM